MWSPQYLITRISYVHDLSFAMYMPKDNTSIFESVNYGNLGKQSSTLCCAVLQTDLGTVEEKQNHASISYRTLPFCRLRGKVEFHERQKISQQVEFLTIIEEKSFKLCIFQLTPCRAINFNVVLCINPSVKIKLCGRAMNATSPSWLAKQSKYTTPQPKRSSRLSVTALKQTHVKVNAVKWLEESQDVKCVVTLICATHLMTL